MVELDKNEDIVEDEIPWRSKENEQRKKENHKKQVRKQEIEVTVTQEQTSTLFKILHHDAPHSAMHEPHLRYVFTHQVTHFQEYYACAAHACSSKQNVTSVFNALSSGQKMV